MNLYNNIDIYQHNNGLCVTKTTGTADNSGQPKRLWRFKGSGHWR
jgi:hypothetical protein